MRKLAVIFALVFASSTEALNRSGFEMSSGPGFRQDRIEWKAFFNDRHAPDPICNHEVYPHLRMFDWMGAVDLSAMGIHTQAMGDWGWFSNQSMRKTTLSALNGESNLAIPGRFEFISKGHVSTYDLRLAYQIDFHRNQWVLLPFAGWFRNQSIIIRNDSIPPFFQTAQNLPAPYILADQSVTFLSKFRQKWWGPIGGANLIWQPIRALSIDMNYAYGWLKLHQNFEETNSSLLYGPGSTSPAIFQMLICNGRIHSNAHGHIARCQLAMNLSRFCSFNIEGRYFYLFSDNATEKAEVSLNEGPFTDAEQKARASINSISAFFEIAFRF